MNRCSVMVIIVLAGACSSAPAATAGHPEAVSSAPGPGHSSVPPAPGPVLLSPPDAAQVFGQGCGQSHVYIGGHLPDWAAVNAPPLPYVVGRPGLVMGYLFTPSLTAGDSASNKILWYVATPRRGQALIAEGHPLDAAGPLAHFTKAADSSPGEIYPSGPAVPSAGCWRFTLTWLGGEQHAEVDLAFA